MNHSNSRSGQRDGAAVVELAVVLPVLMSLVFGSIELCQRIQTRQSVVIAAYEACRVATRRTSDTQTVMDAAESILNAQGVVHSSIQVRNISQSKNNLDGIATGEEIRVRIRINWAPNVISRYVIADSGQLTIFAHMLRE